MHYTLKDHQGNLTATIHGNSMERLRYDDNNSLKGESRNEKYHKKYHPHNSSGGYNHPGGLYESLLRADAAVGCTAWRDEAKGE